MIQDGDRDNPYQSPCVEGVASKRGTALRRTQVADLAIVGGVRGSVIGATISGGIAALLRGCTVLGTRLAEDGQLGELAGVEAVLAEIVGFVTFGAILGAMTGLLMGVALGIVAGRTGTRFRGRFLGISVGASAASGLGWSVLLGLTERDESQAWHPMLPILATFLVILTSALGGAWLALKIADAAWGRGRGVLDSLPKPEAKS